MKKFRIYISAILIGIFLFSNSAVVFADDPEPKTGGLSPIPKPDTIPGPDLGTNPGQVEKKVFTSKILPNLAITIIGYVAIATLLMVVIAGVRYSVSYGEEEQNEKAKNQIIYALFGFLIAMLAYTLVRIIVNLDLGEGIDDTERQANPLATQEESRERTQEELEESFEAAEEAREERSEKIKEEMEELND
ncbi:pilin [Patescibacteria group bacterium]